MTRHRIVLLSVASLVGTGCATIESSINDDAPDQFDRMVVAAERYAPEAVDDLRALGDSSYSNTNLEGRLGGKHVAIECLGQYVAALEWKRQVTTGDVIDVAALEAKRDARTITPDERDLLRAAKRAAELHEASMERCAACDSSGWSRHWSDTLPEDVAIGRRWAARCREQLDDAKELAATQRENGRRAALAAELDALRRADRHTGRAWLRGLRTLQGSAHAASESAAHPDRFAPLVAGVDALAEQEADALRRLAAYEADPTVQRLSSEVASLRDARRLAEKNADDMQRLQTAAGPSTTYSVSGGQTGHDVGSPAVADEAAERARLYQEQVAALDARIDAALDQLAALAMEHGLE